MKVKAQQPPARLWWPHVARVHVILDLIKLEFLHRLKPKAKTKTADWFYGFGWTGRGGCGGAGRRPHRFPHAVFFSFIPRATKISNTHPPHWVWWSICLRAVVTFVSVLIQIFDRFDGAAIFHVDMAFEPFRKIRAVRHHITGIHRMIAFETAA